ncbi:MAG: hypothetical protein ACOX05_01615 [Bacillota bacterium]|jgi:hypothetical protein
MKDTFASLLTIKSLVTLILTVVFAVLALNGTFNGQEFLTIFTVVIAFYFGTQFAKNESEFNEQSKSLETAVDGAFSEQEAPDQHKNS